MPLLAQTPLATGWQIDTIQYEMSGLTQQRVLANTIPIDKTTVFASKAACESYVASLTPRLQSLRIFASVNITAEYGSPNENGITPVALTIKTVDSKNFLVLPFPKIDSNSGFQVKFKIKDNNFLGAMLPLNAEVMYGYDQNEKHIFSTDIDFSLPLKTVSIIMKGSYSFDDAADHNAVINFSLSHPFKIGDFTTTLNYTLKKTKSHIFAGNLYLNFPINPGTIHTRLGYQYKDTLHNLFTGIGYSHPFTAGPVHLNWITDFLITMPIHTYPKFLLSTGLNLFYDFKVGTFECGTSQGILLYDPAKNFSAKPAYTYHMHNLAWAKLYFPIWTSPDFGTLSWTGWFKVYGNWKFKGLPEDPGETFEARYKNPGATFEPSYRFAMTKVTWLNNFRKGINFTLSNWYKYNTHEKGKIKVGLSTSLAWYYPFLDRVGIYGRFLAFYNFANERTVTAGAAVRGILNSRMSTDTGFVLNLDLPIKIAFFDFPKITGVAWSRFFSFELHIVPFLDIALVHDFKSNTYFHPKYGWYAGGIEFILYPHKFRSFYFRASLGLDLTELKAAIKQEDSKRDQSSLSEVYIGIGLHY